MLYGETLVGMGLFDDALMHFAAFIDVAESMKYPGKYLDNNFCRSTISRKNQKFDEQIERLAGDDLRENADCFTFETECLPLDTP